MMYFVYSYIPVIPGVATVAHEEEAHCCTAKRRKGLLEPQQ